MEGRRNAPSPKLVPASWLKRGSVAAATPPASTVAAAVVSIASPKNCPISCDRSAPRALRIPTSVARSAARAVARFMKLMHPSSRMKSPIAENVYTVVIEPLAR
jgi:hypothetical protein